MKMKVPKNTVTGIILTALSEKIKDFGRQSDAYAKAKGWPDYLTNDNYASHNIAAVAFDVQPEGWKKTASYGGKQYYWPKAIKQNAELLSELAALPIVRQNEYNKSIGYRGSFLSRFGMQEAGENWLLKFSEGHEPDPLPEGMEEITVAAYRALITPTVAAD